MFKNSFENIKTYLIQLIYPCSISSSTWGTFWKCGNAAKEAWLMFPNDEWKSMRFYVLYNLKSDGSRLGSLTKTRVSTYADKELKQVPFFLVINNRKSGGTLFKIFLIFII